MYIEQLTQQDFNKFASLFNCSVSQIKQSSNNKLYLQLFTGAMGPQPELWLSDFNLTTSSYYKFAEKQLKEQYILFMNTKFGKSYKENYTNYYNNKIKEDRIL